MRTPEWSTIENAIANLKIDSIDEIWRGRGGAEGKHAVISVQLKYSHLRDEISATIETYGSTHSFKGEIPPKPVLEQREGRLFFSIQYGYAYNNWYIPQYAPVYYRFHENLDTVMRAVKEESEASKAKVKVIKHSSPSVFKPVRQPVYTLEFYDERFGNPWLAGLKQS